MDVGQKKQQVLEELANQPLNVVYIRVDICDQVQLADLLKADFIPYLRGPANTAHSNTDSLHEVCTNLAKQRALLQGAAITDVLSFKIDDGTAATRAAGTATHNSTGDLSFGKLEDSDYSNKTTFGYVTLHDLNETGGSVTLSSTTNANTTIVNDDGENVKYFTDFSKYFLTRSRANGELISVDGNTSPYISPTSAEPFIPANTVNGETFAGTVADPSANTDVRHEFVLVANTSAIGYVGANTDIAENKYVGNTFVTIEMSEVNGTFQTAETITDFDQNSATVKSYANTSTILLNGFSGKGTFTVGETLTDLTSNATVESTTVVSNTETIVTLTGSTFLTGSNTDISLGFSLSNTVALDTNAISRVGTTVTVTSDGHGINPGERIALTGADDVYNEFNNTFVVEDTTENTLKFSTANTGTTIPSGDINMITNIVYGVTSNASIAIQRRTTNASANVVFQSANLSAGFPIGNVVTGSTGGATGTINTRTSGGSWYQTRTNEVKTFYTNSTSGTWDYDATNNPVGIESTANSGVFWNKEFEPVKINQLVASTGSGGTFVAPKVVLDIALATTSNPTGGFDATVQTKVPGVYLAYPLKTWEDQTHDGTVTLEAYQNFANLVVAPEGLEINFDWKPLANSSVAATNYNSGTGTGDIYANGVVTTAAYHPEECTVLDEGEFNTHLGPYSGIATQNASGGFPNAQNDDILLSSIPSNRSRAIKVGTSGAVYPSANANPFYPAVGGTHKEIANTSDDFTGTQPGSLTANDIYAGAYTEYQKGAIEPPASANTALHPAEDYRYVIQNDQKWIYASNVFDANSSTTGSYNVPRTTDIKNSIFDGSLTSEIGSVVSEAAVSATSASSIVGSVQTNPTMPIPADNAVTCSTVSHLTSNSGGPNTGTLYTIGIVGSHSNMVMITSQTCTGTNYSCVSPTGDPPEGGWTSSTCATAGGTWTAGGVEISGSPVEFACLFNRVQYLMTSNGGALTVDQTTNMETNFAIFYQLLVNLTSASYGKNYTDPVEQTAAGSYAELGRSDASFKTAVETMKSRVDTLIGLHNTERSSVTTAMNGSNAYTHPVTYQNAFNSMTSYLAEFKPAVGNRITEISNRIGYLNGKNVASGGGVFVAGVTAIDYLLLDSTNGSANAGDNVLHENNDLVQLEAQVSESISVGSAGDGFAGYTFSGGSGYANTIYSHCNFLAGKKIQLVAKILKAVESVTDIYNQIKAKRAEYYEYNA